MIELGDVPIIEFRQHSLFSVKPFPPGWRPPGVQQDLDRNQLAGILVLGQVDHPHATFTKMLFDPVRVEVLKGHRFT